MNEEIKNLKELLEIISQASSKVFIIGHEYPDFDSVGSAIGLQSLCESLGKRAYIIINDSAISLGLGVKKIIDANIYEHKIITLDEFEAIKDPSSTLIVTDNNKKDRIAVGEMLDEFRDIIILDHHQTDENTIENAAHYINQNISSASEIVAQLIMNAKVNCPASVYTYLLSGIVLDTGRFAKNTTSKTHDVAKRLINKGADYEYVKELFLADFDDDKKINLLVYNGTVIEAYDYSLFHTHNVSFTLNRDQPHTIYRREQIAKAADKMLKYRVDATFAMGYVDDTSIAISARSKGAVDVGKIMACLGGGGNTQNAGAKVSDMSIEDVEEMIKASIIKGVDVDALITPPVEETPETPKQFVKV